MKKLNYMAVITAGIMSACSPKVTTEMMTQSFTPQPTNKVMIYGTRDRVPEASRAIGQVQVDTRQASMKKQYTKALNLAVKETAQHGGNVLVVDHSELDKNLLKGTIAYMDGKVADSLTISPTRIKQLQAMTRKQNKSTIKQMEDHEQQALAQRQEEVRQQEIEKLQSLTEPKEENNETWETKEIASGEAASYFDLDNNEEKTSKGYIKLTVGPVWTSSKLYTNIDGSDYVSGLRGTGIDLSVISMGKGIWSYGFDFYGSQATTKIKSNYIENDYSYTLLYVGPCAQIGGNIFDWMHADLSFGLGMSYMDNNGDSQTGFGGRFALGLEFLVSNQIGIGVEAMRQIATFKRPDGFNQPKDEAYGIENIGLMAMVRIHL